MEEHQERAALILIQATQGIIHERRRTEMFCGYPPEYGGDELLIKRIDEFLSNSDIQHEVKQALKFAKKFKDHKPPTTVA